MAELFGSLSKRLERIVRGGVHAPDAVIEDACQLAWTRLVHHHSKVRRDAALAWLVTTAVHEALKLARRGQRELSLDAELEAQDEIDAPDPRPGPAEAYEQLERLDALAALPPRQQRLLWLRGLGLSYGEIAVRDASTPRTVERQLQRARAGLRAAGAARTV